MRRLALLIAGLLCAGPAPAFAEVLVLSLSNHRVAITSSFVGEELVLFGTVEPDANSTLRSGRYDIVVTVTGPLKTYRTRRKARVLGIWVNVDSREFLRVPAYLAILANRPVAEISNPDSLRRLQVGLDNFLLTQRVGADFADTVREDPFRASFIHLETQSGLYSERTAGVTFLTASVFRAAIPVPSNAPVGNYSVEVKLFANGALITRDTSTFEIVKAGIEQYLADAAVDHGLLYGLATALLALLTGWFASVAFRKD